MKPTVLLRIASVLTAIHGILHTIGGVLGSPAPGPQQTAVAAMKANTFPLMGNTRSFWDFYFGMGLAVSILMLAEAIAFWQLGAIAKTDAVRLRPILATFLIAYLGFAVDSTLYFFPAPAAFEVLIAACLGAAIYGAKRSPVPESYEHGEVIHSPQ